VQQDRLQAVGLTSSAVAQQLQFLLNGIPVTAVREDIRTVQVTARSAGNVRLDPAKIGDFTLAGANGQRIPLSQVGKIDVRMEEPIIRRRDRMPTITVRGDIADGLQPPDVSTAISKQLQPIIEKLPAGYRIEQAGSIEESGKATKAMLPLFPIMLAVTLLILIFQVRSIPAMVMVFLTSPLGLIGVVPTLILFGQPFGINALVGLIALSGILMRNTLIGGTFAGTVMTLVFLPAMYAIWFRIAPAAEPAPALAEAAPA
jgi:multidrug efflux pump subunit AcrB